MKNENPESREKRPRLAGLYLILVILFVLAIMPEAKNAGASPPLAETPAAAAPQSDSVACGNLKPEEVYARLKKETLSHNTYTATYFHQTERGKKHEIFVRGRLSGKYNQKPGLWCETRLELEASFPEQAGPGHQECYSAQDDLNRILMAGAYRVLGVITMFPEDPKASYLNGENMNNTAVWTWFKKWDRMLEGGRLSAQCETRQGRPAWVLTIKRGKNPDPLYHHHQARIWVDPDRWFPIRVETYVPDDPKPVVIYDFEAVQLDVPPTEKEIAFAGLAPGWNLVSVPGGPQLAGLAQEQPGLQDSAGLDPNRFLALLDQALAEVKDYSTELTLELRYRRLRQYRQDRFQFIRLTNSFASLTTHLESNYILINSGKGFRTVGDPARDKLIHILPAGVYRVMGEQTFPTDDPRLFTALGDNITGLNFFAVRDELKRRLDAAKVKVNLATYRDGKGPWLEAVGPDLGIPAQPTVIRLLLDEKTRLPLRLEYRGYDDLQGYLTIRFSNTKVNSGLKSEDLWE